MRILQTTVPGLNVRFAASADVPMLLEFIRELARFEKLEDQVVATEQTLGRALFGPRPFAEALLVAELERTRRILEARMPRK